MATLFGFNAFLKVGKEATWGTEQMSSAVDIRLNSSTLQTSQERPRKTNLSVPATGMLESTYSGFRNSGGSIDVPVVYDGIGVLFDAALGSSSSSGAADPYTHTYVPAFDLPSLSVKFQRGSNLSNSSELFLGCKVSTMSISCDAGGEMTASFELIAKDSEVRGTDITSSFGTGANVLHFESGKLVMGGTLAPANMEIRSFECTLDNKLERKNVLGSKITSEQVMGDVREVTMSITADLDDNSVYTDQLDGKTGDVYIEFTSTGDSNHFFQITLTNAVIEDYSDSVTAFGRVERTFSIRGLASSTKDGLEIKIANANASALY